MIVIKSTDARAEEQIKDIAPLKTHKLPSHLLASLNKTTCSSQCIEIFQRAKINFKIKRETFYYYSGLVCLQKICAIRYVQSAMLLTLREYFHIKIHIHFKYFCL